MFMAGVLIWAMFSFCGLALSASPEPTEFIFNRSAAVLHGRAAVEDFGALMMKEQPLAKFDFEHPRVAGLRGRDCADQEIYVVLVAFPGKKTDGWAYSYWERNRDGLISRLLSVGFSVESLEYLIEQGRSGGSLCR
jgi:hypothetical protein